jgi:hypothetical protein
MVFGWDNGGRSDEIRAARVSATAFVYTPLGNYIAVHSETLGVLSAAGLVQ